MDSKIIEQQLGENSLFQEEVWNINYKYEDEKSYLDTAKRLAKSVSSIEEKNQAYYEEKFYEILSNYEFVPGGRIISNAGTETTNTYMNCFTYNLPNLTSYNVDSIIGIAESLKAQMLILASEGGYGTNFSFIRPKGSLIKGSKGLHPGVVKYMELWNKSSEIITLGAPYPRGQVDVFYKKRPRKGAMMAILDVWHPDIIDFIQAKNSKDHYLQYFNISVGITKEFMETLSKDDYWYLEFPDTSHPEYISKWNGILEDWKKQGLPTIVYEKHKASYIWNLIMESTYNRNEPGVVFLDKINDLNPISYAEVIRQTNPCGEQPLGEADSCNLGAINLVKFYKDGTFDFDRFRFVTRLAIRFLDNVIDLSPYPIPSIRENTLKKRRVGLGIMGLGSLFYLFNYKYGDSDSINLTKEIFREKCKIELETSALLGKEKGDFPLFDKEKYFSTKWWKNLPLDSSFKKYIEFIGHMRNSHRSTVAPTGNTSILAGIVSGGIEPVFMKSYKRYFIVPLSEVHSLEEKGYKIPKDFTENEHFKKAKKGDEEVLVATIEGKEYEYSKSSGLRRIVHLKDQGYSLAKEKYGESENFVEVKDLTIYDHIKILEVASKYVDSAISKTVNIPSNYPFENFKNLYLKAYYSASIKGLTSYREGSMIAVLESEDSKTEVEETEFAKLLKNSKSTIEDIPTKLEDNFLAEGHIFRDGKSKYYIILAFLKTLRERPFAIFITSNTPEKSDVTEEIILALESLAYRSGILEKHIISNREKSKHQPNIIKIARVLGLLLRHNVPIIDIVDVLNEVSSNIKSVVHFIRKLLSNYIPNHSNSRLTCQICKHHLTYEEGCLKCLNCGWSKC